MLKRLQPQLFMIFEAGFIGLFFVQAMRFLIAMLYSRTAGASVVSALSLSSFTLPDPLPIDPSLVATELSTLLALLILPLIGMFIAQWSFMPLIAAGLVVAGRVLMFNFNLVSPTTGAAFTVCAGLLYILVMARHRLRALPYLFVLGFSADMLIRAFGNTVDISLEARWLAPLVDNLPAFFSPQFLLATVALLLAVLTFFLANQRRATDEIETALDRGLLPFWGGIGLGGLLFLWMSLFGLPNAVTARAQVDYTLFTPALIGAALLPIIPAVRGAARSFIGAFDGSVRGWLWMLLGALLLVLGTRLNGVIAGIALTGAAFVTSLLWWWIARPKGEKERTLGGIWILIGIGLFALLLIAENFTYDYAYVRDFSGDFAFLNAYIPPLLRGFRGFGYVLLLLGLLFAAIPMAQTQRRIPWSAGAGALTSLVMILVVAGAIGASVIAVRPPVISGVRDVESLRVATYNIHGGYDEYYRDSLEAVALAIQTSGADVVLLQEVEAGRLASFGVDQSLWLARRLGMDRRFLGTNEDLQGLAVLSRVAIAFDDGALLSSLSSQTGVQRVQIVPATDVVLTLYNTWLSPLFDLSGAGDDTLANQEQDQQRQLNEIFVRYLGGACGLELGRTIIGGTMHNVPDSPIITQMRGAGFSDPFAGQAIEISATFERQGQPRARFDYLWLCNLPSAGVGVLPNSASDHRIAYSEVELTP